MIKSLNTTVNNLADDMNPSKHSFYYDIPMTDLRYTLYLSFVKFKHLSSVHSEMKIELKVS